MFNSMYGRISHGAWCEKEVRRLEAQGRTAEVREGKNGVAVWANRIAKER